MSLTPLTDEAIRQRLRTFPGWTGDPSGLNRTLRFGSFGQAIAFMQACVPGIDRLDHHPVWRNVYHRVEIHLDTADLGHVVTERDFALAAWIDEVLAARGAALGFAADTTD
jgi:4a-hydroxytetrahydrobiopterin dehydratase